MIRVLSQISPTCINTGRPVIHNVPIVSGPRTLMPVMVPHNPPAGHPVYYPQYVASPWSYVPVVETYCGDGHGIPYVTGEYPNSGYINGYVNNGYNEAAVNNGYNSGVYAGNSYGESYDNCTYVGNGDAGGYEAQGAGSGQAYDGGDCNGCGDCVTCREPSGFGDAGRPLAAEQTHAPTTGAVPYVLPGAGEPEWLEPGVDLSAQKSVQPDGSDLPQDIPTLRFFFNLGVGMHNSVLNGQVALPPPQPAPSAAAPSPPPQQQRQPLYDDIQMLVRKLQHALNNQSGRPQQRSCTSSTSSMQSRATQAPVSEPQSSDSADSGVDLACDSSTTSTSIWHSRLEALLEEREEGIEESSSNSEGNSEHQQEYQQENPQEIPHGEQEVELHFGPFPVLEATQPSRRGARGLHNHGRFPLNQRPADQARGSGSQYAQPGHFPWSQQPQARGGGDGGGGASGGTVRARRGGKRFVPMAPVSWAPSSQHQGPMSGRPQAAPAPGSSRGGGSGSINTAGWGQTQNQRFRDAGKK